MLGGSFTFAKTSCALKYKVELSELWFHTQIEPPEVLNLLLVVAFIL